MPVTLRTQPISGYVHSVQRPVFAVPASPLKVSCNLTTPVLSAYVSRNMDPTPEISVLPEPKFDCEANQVADPSAVNRPHSSKVVTKCITMESLLETFGTPRDTIDQKECDIQEGSNPDLEVVEQCISRTPSVFAEEPPTGVDVCIDANALHDALVRDLSEQVCSRTFLTDTDVNLDCAGIVHDVLGVQDGAPQFQEKIAWREAQRTPSSVMVPPTSRDSFPDGAHASSGTPVAQQKTQGGEGRWTPPCVSVPPTCSDECHDGAGAVSAFPEVVKTPRTRSVSAPLMGETLYPQGACPVNPDLGVHEKTEHGEGRRPPSSVSVVTKGADVYRDGVHAVHDALHVQERTQPNDGLNSAIAAVPVVHVINQVSNLDSRSVEACETAAGPFEPMHSKIWPVVDVCETSETRGPPTACVPQNFEWRAPSQKGPVVLPLQETHGHVDSPTTVKRTLGKVITCQVKEVPPGPTVCVDLPAQVILRVVADGPCNVEVSVERAELGSLPEAAVAA